MSGSQTLNSKIRVLIAKTYRAEKLYASLRNSNESGGNPLSLGINKLVNESRAKEWQTNHEHFRALLNDTVRLGNSRLVIQHLEVMLEQFYARYVESSAALDRGASRVAEAVRRQEFALIIKLSVDLIRHKARAQASKVISDELDSLLESVGHGSRSKAHPTGQSALGQPHTGTADLEQRRLVAIESRNNGNVDENDDTGDDNDDYENSFDFIGMPPASPLNQAPGNGSPRQLEPEMLGAKIIPLKRRDSREQVFGQNKS